MKYVIFDMGGMEGEQIFIFSKFLNHNDFTSYFSSYEVKSAGFVNFNVNVEGDVEGVCFGESVSLGLKSRLEDSKILKSYMNPKY